MKKRMTGTVQARVSADIKLKIQKFCDKNELDESDIVRMALDYFFKNLYYKTSTKM